MTRIVDRSPVIASEDLQAEQQAQLNRLYQLTADVAYSYSVLPSGGMLCEWLIGDPTPIQSALPSVAAPRGCWSVIAHGDDLPVLEARSRRLAAGERSVDEFRIVTPERQVRWLRVYGLPEWDGTEGRIVRILGAVKDITAEKQAQEQLYRAERACALATLTHSLASDFSKALKPVVALSDLGTVASSGKPEMHDCFLAINQASKRAMELVSSVLALSDDDRSDFQPLLVGEVVMAQLQEMSGGVPAEVAVRCGVDSNLPEVRGSAVQLSHLVRQLVRNALDAMKGGGTLSVRVGLAAEAPAALAGKRCLRVTVADTGHGMDALTRGRVFDPFFTTKSVEGHSGLGLAVVHRIVEHHGGAITVASEPGRGTTFAVYLPAEA